MKPRFWRSIKLGCSLVIFVAVMLLGAVTGFRWQNLKAWFSSVLSIGANLEYINDLESPEKMLAYLAEHKSDVAFVAYSLQEDGTPIPESRIALNPDTPMPLANLHHLLILAAYAQAVQNDTLSPDTPVALSDWQAYYLPEADGRIHFQVMNALDIETEPTGFAQDASQTVPISQLVRAMIRYGDLPSADYLQAHLGADQLMAVARQVDIQYPASLSMLGIILSWRNHQQPNPDENHLAELTALSLSEYAELTQSLVQNYQDPAWRQAELTWRSNDGRVVDLPYQILAANSLLPTGTAAEYAQLMGLVLQGQFISPDLSEMMAQYLTWPEEIDEISRIFSRVATRGGLSAGVINEANFFVPTQGEFAGQPRITVLLLKNLPPAAFIRLQQTQGYQQFAFEVALEGDFAQQSKITLAE